jgi:hypothetical protein
VTALATFPRCRCPAPLVVHPQKHLQEVLEWDQAKIRHAKDPWPLLGHPRRQPQKRVGPAAPPRTGRTCPVRPARPTCTGDPCPSGEWSGKGNPTFRVTDTPYNGSVEAKRSGNSNLQATLQRVTKGEHLCHQDSWGRILQTPNGEEIQDHWAQDSPWVWEAIHPSVWKGWFGAQQVHLLYLH